EKQKESCQSIADAVRDGALRGVAGSRLRGEVGWSVKVDMVDYLRHLPLDRFEKIYVDLSALAGGDASWAACDANREKVVLSMPIVRDPSVDYGRMVEDASRRGYAEWQAQNLGDIHLFRSRGVRWYADWPLYVVNGAAVDQLLAMGAARVTFSPEDDMQNLTRTAAAAGPFGETIVYQDTPLCVSRVCGLKDRGGCPPVRCTDASPETAYSDAADELIALRRGCVSYIVARRPFCVSRFVPDLLRAGAERMRIDLCYRRYSGKVIERVVSRVMECKGVDGGSHSANFSRTLL
ncbi:MAG TPA: hypothetical protein P5287_07125, partial [bacterium]|nr:hypothetical protein [bacterium]